MICYTRNFEDVILQRVFGDIAQGCYLDVGASLPVEDSNTYALYERGWRGLALEPLPFGKQWAQSRPEDQFLNVAVGAKSGHVNLRIFPHTQLSSAMPTTITHWQAHGQNAAAEMVVPCVTLNDVLDQHLAGRELHLVSIDVEGMEHEVLKGIDLHRFRPWVIVLEAVLPGTPAHNHHEWEPLLRRFRYDQAYFDGVNRFYLAEERESLRERFALPPNVWDQFEIASQIALRQENHALKAEVAALRAKLADAGNSPGLVAPRN
ncbi:MAG: FkbM family methyltransferase [Rhodocyclales bacterium]|nr:FkbM family methyltransferase [Rhodocyclales bacterium]